MFKTQTRRGLTPTHTHTGHMQDTHRPRTDTYHTHTHDTHHDTHRHTHPTHTHDTDSHPEDTHRHTLTPRGHTPSSAVTIATFETHTWYETIPSHREGERERERGVT